MNELKRILRKTNVKQVGEYYCLDEAHLMESAERYRQSEKFWKKVGRSLWVFANVPFVKMVMVSNTLAYDYVTNDSDIDIFTVAAKDRVWTVRAFLLTYLSLFGIRASRRHKRMRFSPEILVDETAIDLSPSALAEDYLTHYFIADLVPIWGADYFNEFWAANRWIRNKLPVAYRSPNLKDGFDAKSKSSLFVWALEKMLGGRFGDRVEMWARRRQQRTIDRAVVRLGVDPNVIKERHVIETHYCGRRVELRDNIEEFLALDEKEFIKV